MVMVEKMCKGWEMLGTTSVESAESGEGPLGDGGVRELKCTSSQPEMMQGMCRGCEMFLPHSSPHAGFL